MAEAADEPARGDESYHIRKTGDGDAMEVDQPCVHSVGISSGKEADVRAALANPHLRVLDLVSAQASASVMRLLEARCRCGTFAGAPAAAGPHAAERCAACGGAYPPAAPLRRLTLRSEPCPASRAVRVGDSDDGEDKFGIFASVERCVSAFPRLRLLDILIPQVSFFGFEVNVHRMRIHDVFRTTTLLALSVRWEEDERKIGGEHVLYKCVFRRLPSGVTTTKLYYKTCFEDDFGICRHDFEDSYDEGGFFWRREKLTRGYKERYDEDALKDEMDRADADAATGCPMSLCWYAVRGCPVPPELRPTILGFLDPVPYSYYQYKERGPCAMYPPAPPPPVVRAESTAELLVRSALPRFPGAGLRALVRASMPTVLASANASSSDGGGTAGRGSGGVSSGDAGAPPDGDLEFLTDEACEQLPLTEGGADGGADAPEVGEMVRCAASEPVGNAAASTAHPSSAPDPPTACRPAPPGGHAPAVLCGRVLREEALQLRKAYAVLADRGLLPRSRDPVPAPPQVGTILARMCYNGARRRKEFHVTFFLRGARLGEQERRRLQEQFIKGLPRGLRCKAYTTVPVVVCT